MADNKRVLIVDDDPDFLDLLATRIAMLEEFVPTAAANGMAGIEQTETADFDLILLDAGLPDIDGREACRLMRRHGVIAPIIMMSGAAGDADMILGLDAGADDYIVKPFRMDVLVARMRAQFK